MATLKYKDISKLGEEDLKKKMKDLKLELIKSNAQKSMQGAVVKTKEIKKAIARILTYIKTKKHGNLS